MDSDIKMEKMKKIFVVDDIALIKANLERVKSALEIEEASVIALSDPVFLFLKTRGINCISHHDFERPGMYEKIYSTSCKWGSNWYKPKGSDLASEGVFSLGEMVEWSMIYFFSHFLRLYVSLREIIGRTCPREVICFTCDGEGDIGDHEELQKTGAKLLCHLIREYISSEEPETILRTVELPNMPISEKRKQSLIRRFSCRVNFIVSRIRTRGSKEKKILFFEGARHFRQIMRDSRMKKFDITHLEKTIGPSLLPGFYLEGINVITLDEAKDTRINTRPRETESLMLELAGFFRHEGKDLISYVWPRIEFLFNNFFPNIVAADIKKVKDIIEKIKPDCVVAENNSTYYERMLLTIARNKDVSTIVIQDGNTRCDKTNESMGLVFHNFIPLISDVFLAFGEASKDWFRSMGADEDRVVVTGASRFDEYYSKCRNTRTGRRKKNKVAVIMDDIWNKEGVVTHHIGLNVSADHLRKFIDFAKKNPEIDIVIRPHDRHHLWNEVMREELANVVNIRISRQKALKDLFQEVDLVIGYPSTALIEALIHRIPVISIDTGDFFNYLPLWEHGLSKRVSDFSKLGEAVQPLLYNDTERELAERNIDRNLWYFNHGDDGLATYRIVGEIYRIMMGKDKGNNARRERKILEEKIQKLRKS